MSRKVKKEAEQIFDAEFEKLKCSPNCNSKDISINNIDAIKLALDYYIKNSNVEENKQDYDDLEASCKLKILARIQKNEVVSNEGPTVWKIIKGATELYSVYHTVISMKNDF